MQFIPEGTVFYTPDRSDVRGWVEVDTFDVWCLDCGGAVEDLLALRFAAMPGRDGEVPVMPVLDDWADRQELACRHCGGAL